MHSLKLFSILVLLLCNFRSFGLNILRCAGQTLERDVEKLFVIPEEIGENDITLILYNRNNKEGKKLNENDGGALFIQGLPLVLVTHGWLANSSSPTVTDVVNGYLQYLERNIISVDWQNLAGQDYISASYNTRKVGKAVGELVVRLERDNLCTLNGTHLMGHSLGAHVMGVAGHQIQEATGEKVGRITGLDAAGPLFEVLQLNPEYKLDSSDAVFVENIHTNIIVGYTGPLGHADFFPNGGLAPQPGCNPLNSTGAACSHFRAPIFFTESIGNKTAFLSTECSSYLDYLSNTCEGNPTAHMGQWTPWSTRGKYYLTTRSTSPFSK